MSQAEDYRDPEQWDEESAQHFPPVENPRLQLRLTFERAEMRELAAAAAAAGLPLTAYAKRALLAHLHSPATHP